MRFAFAKIAALGVTGVALGSRVRADEQLPDLPVRGAPQPGGVALQTPASSIQSEVVFLDNLLLWIIVPITLLVVGLLIWVAVFYNRRANPTASRFSHNTPLEVAWTGVPALILLVIAFFSFPALRHQQVMPEADVTIKTTGYQWYWTYDYINHGINFASFMLERDELAEHGYTQEDYRLATDTAMVVPVDKNIVVQVTGGDVIHSWTIPAFGVKQDGIPGRVAELWFRPEETGVYFGQCSELCGINHAFMPITVKVVSEEEYLAWLERQGAEIADASNETDIEVAISE